jgi:hypothetical protein
MSRHEIPAIYPDHKIVVGWDHPLLTYFGIVYNTAKEAEDNETGEIIAWVGTSLRELYEIDDLQHAIRSHVAIFSPELRVTLYGDKDEGR